MLLDELIESGAGGGGGGSESTLAWKPKVDEDGNLTWTRTISTTTPTPQNIKGKDGAGVKEIKKDENGHFICTLTDGTVLDAGVLAEPKLKQSLTATVNIGSIKSGEKHIQSALLLRLF